MTNVDGEGQAERTARELEAAIAGIKEKLLEARQSTPASDALAGLSAERDAALARVEGLNSDLAAATRALEQARTEAAAAAAKAAQAETSRADLEAVLAKEQRERTAGITAFERRERELQSLIEQRDRMLEIESERRVRTEAVVAELRGALADKEAGLASGNASLRAQLASAEQALARQEQVASERDKQLAALEGGSGKAKEKAQQTERQVAELKQRVDQSIAERDKARSEVAAIGAAMEARLADATRQMEAMGQEVRQAWDDRAAAERRIEQVVAKADADAAESARRLAEKRRVLAESTRAMQGELGRLRARAAALDSLTQSVGMEAQSSAAELEKMRGVATLAVEEARTLSQQLVESLTEVQSLNRLVARMDQARMASSASPDPVQAGTGQSPSAGWPDQPQRSEWALLEQPLLAPAPPKPATLPTVATADAVVEPAAQKMPTPEAKRDVLAVKGPSPLLLAKLSGLDVKSGGAGQVWAVAEGIEFIQGSARLDQRSMRGLERVATLLQLAPAGKVRIVGHTDARGDARRNRTLSEERAAAVKAALIEQFEVDATRVTVEGAGADHPVASNATADGRKANRRVEIFLEQPSVVLGQNDPG